MLVHLRNPGKVIRVERRKTPCRLAVHFFKGVKVSRLFGRNLGLNNGKN
jgi:hypothetical protein